MIDRQEWLEARRKGIGGTDAAAILGLSKWRSAVDVWEDKLGVAPERPQTAAMLWGLRLEEVIAAAYTETTGRRVRRVGMRRARHVKTFPMLGSIDRMTYLSDEAPRVVELKKKRSADDLGTADDPPYLRVPPDWYLQTQHYLEVVDAEIADVAVLVGGTDFRIIEIPRDRDYGADLIEEEARFWRDYVEAGVQPPVGPDDLAFLGRKYPASSGEEIVATSELALTVEAYLDAVAEVERYEGLRDGYRAKIEDAMGTASRLVSGSASVSWKSHERKSTAWREIAGGYRSAIESTRTSLFAQTQRDVDRALSEGFGTTNLDDVEGLFTTTSPVRPFRVERKKEGAK